MDNWQQSLPYLVVAIIVIVYAVKDYRQHKNVVQALTDAARDIRSDPVALANAKAAADSVPQSVFDGLFDVLHGVLAVASGTPIGDLADELQEDIEQVDHDPTNDDHTGQTIT